MTHARRTIPARALATAGALTLLAAPALADETASAVRFACDAGKTIDATFWPDKVALKLSDGRSITLPQAMSGSGARYANKDETFVFWNKGNTAFITEGAGDNAPMTYTGCISLSDDRATRGYASFASAEAGFSIRYPQGYAVDRNYKFTGLGPHADIPGVAFTIPKAMTAGTNLVGDTRLSVERLEGVTDCDAALFLPVAPSAVKKINDRGTEYSVASLQDAGAGNEFDSRVYALIGTSPCLAVRYFIHSANIGNFDPGTVKPYDLKALLRQFDTIRRSLTIGQ
jgi:membrane-bound inhibitor of C-type lysozyme